jgi:hypothetical protein
MKIKDASLKTSGNKIGRKLVVNLVGA